MELNKEIIKGHVESIILSLLQEKDLYGYEISKLIRENSKEAFEVKDGTLYVVLKRLEKLGLVYYTGVIVKVVVEEGNILKLQRMELII